MSNSDRTYYPQAVPLTLHNCTNQFIFVAHIEQYFLYIVSSNVFAELILDS